VTHKNGSHQTELAGAGLDSLNLSTEKNAVLENAAVIAQNAEGAGQ